MLSVGSLFLLADVLLICITATFLIYFLAILSVEVHWRLNQAADDAKGWDIRMWNIDVEKVEMVQKSDLEL